MMRNQYSGRLFIIGFAAVIALVAVFGFLELRHASDRRFAISIHAIPESPHADLLPLHVPILVRIDKHSAGRSPLTAFAMLLDGNGRLLADLQPLVVSERPDGKRAEQVIFSPLTAMPDQRLLAAVVLRLPQDQVETARAQIAEILRAAPAPSPSGQSSLPGVFGRVLMLSRQLGGHAELTQVEVREKL